MNDDFSDFGTILEDGESFTFGELIDDHPVTKTILTNSSNVMNKNINEWLGSFDGDAIQTVSGWDLINSDDQFIGAVLDGELAELELSGLKFHKFPFRGFGRLSC